MSQKIRIKLKSYDYNLVDKSADKIVKTVKTTGAVVTGPIPLPTHKNLHCTAFAPREQKITRAISVELLQTPVGYLQFFFKNY